MIEVARFRVGHGYDIHRLVPDRPLVLAGVTLPWDIGLGGHSDGDAVCHAVMDAVLGAAGAGDIGQRFPQQRPRFEGARSLDLLASLGPVLEDAGLSVINVDVTVLLEVPSSGPTGSRWSPTWQLHCGSRPAAWG